MNVTYAFMGICATNTLSPRGKEVSHFLIHPDSDRRRFCKSREDQVLISILCRSGKIHFLCDICLFIYLW